MDHHPVVVVHVYEAKEIVNENNCGKRDKK
jgi:hypothetical protein